MIKFIIIKLCFLDIIYSFVQHYFSNALGLVVSNLVYNCYISFGSADLHINMTVFLHFCAVKTRLIVCKSIF